MTRRRAAPLAVCAAVVLAACTSGASPTPSKASPTPSTTARPNMLPLVLTPDAPRGVVELDAAQHPDFVDLRILSIENPGGQGFALTVRLPEVEELGVVTPYPTDRPGTFSIRIPERSRSRLRRLEGRVVVEIGLEPVAAQRSLESPLAVTVDKVVLRSGASPSP